MRRLSNVLVSACLLFGLAGHTNAKPVFNVVNSVYANGTACPAITKNDIACPLLCVKDPATQCPLAIAPTCGTGLQFCGDGTCKASCAGISNICMCGHDASSLIEVLQPCKLGQLVNITNFNLAEKDSQTRKFCTAALGLKNVSQWTDVLAKTVPADGAPVWQSCEPPADINFTYREPMWIAIWTVYFGFYVILGLWVLYKRFREKDIPSALSLDVVSIDSNEKKVAIHAETPDFIVKGYNNNLYGTFMILYIFGISLGFFAMLFVETLDYYGLVTGNFYGVFLDSYPLSSKIFCGTWFFATSWLLGINFTKSRIRNFFRIRVLPEHARFVQIEKKREVVVLLDDRSPFLTRIRNVEDAVRKALGFDYIVSTSPILLSSQGHRYFEFQCARFVFNKETTRFEPFRYNLGSEHQSLLKQQHGLTSEEAARRLEMIGPNFVQVKVPNFAWAMWQEFTGFFYLYQIMILWLFFYLDYWQIGISDTGVIILAALVKVIIRLRSEHRIKKMAEHEDLCTILRDGKWVQMSTANLVPGDVFEVQCKVVPVDGIILDGDIIADESSLTGEPLPIRKFPIKEDSQTYDRNTHGKIATLFAGTTVAQSVSITAGQKPKALVTETGTNTDKGRLIHKILFPHAVSFIFHEQLKFVFILLLVWGFILMGFGIWFLGGTGMAAWFYGMFCISQVMSPILPAVLVVGQSVAASSLRKKGIFCVDLNRIVMAGKTQIFCFDKTGTLTKEGLEFYGAQPVATREGDDNKQTASFEDHAENFTALNSTMRMGLATCHSVAILDGQYIGNPVDIEMFLSTKWELDETPEAGYVDTVRPRDDPKATNPIHIVKRCEFQHARASMSVAVLDTATNHVHIFVKGSFEKIKEISSVESIPADFDNTATKLAREGCYVLGMAHRNLGVADLDMVRGWTRDQLESKVAFAGLVLFKNMLKHDTAQAIHDLKEGNTRTVMITGDNALTGIYIARSCGMIPDANRILLGDLLDGNVVWKDVDTNESVEVDAILADKGLKPVELAVTGKAFNILNKSDLMRKYLLDTRVFARMTPTDKITCVQLHMERGITAMCGDGGNDCGALRAAHVGIAMSEAEASIVSPFSTNQRTVMSCVELLIQGRAALATSFAGYKYLIMYGETMASLKLHTFYFSISPSQNTWIFVDAFVTVGLSFAVTQALANNKLSHYRPTSRILGPETLASVFGQMLINVCFLIGSFIWLFQLEWFRCQEFDARNTDASKWWLLGDNFESAVLGFVTLFQFVNSASVFNFGYMFRRPWYRNWLLVIIWATFIAIVSYWELADPNYFGCMFRFNCGDPDVLVSLGYPRPTWTQEVYNITQGHNVLPRDFRYKLWVYSICNMIAVHAWEYFVVLGPVRNWLREKRPLPRTQLKL